MESLNRQLAPDIKAVGEINYNKPDESVLINGIPLRLIKGGSQDILRIEFLFHSGSYNQQKPLQAYITTNLLKSGTKTRSASDISKLWDFYGASLQIEAQKDIISVGFFCLTKHFEPLLDLLFEVITESVFPESELELLLNNRKNKHIINSKKVSHLARVHFNEMIFGKEHPYGRILTLNDFDDLSREDVLKYFEQNFTSDNCTCFISGKIPDDITSIMNAKIRKFAWKSGQGKFIPLQTNPENKPQSINLHMKNALQSSVRIGKRMLNRTHTDYSLVSVTNSLLGGFFGSRLMKNIRQDKGYTYGINSSVVSLLQDAYFFIGTQVGNQVKEKAIEQIFHEVKNLRELPASNEDLTILRNYLSAGFLRSFDGPFMQMERFKELYLFGIDSSYFDAHIELLASITAEQIMETAGKYFHEDDMYVIVAG